LGQVFFVFGHVFDLFQREQLGVILAVLIFGGISDQFSDIFK